MAEEVLEQSPDHVRALLVQGDAALVNRDAELAIEHIGRAVELSPFDQTPPGTSWGKRS